MVQSELLRPNAEGFSYVPPEYEEEVAQVKRLLEYISMVPGFAQQAKEQPEQALKTAEVSLGVEDVRCMFPEKGAKERPELSAAVRQYQQFIQNKLRFRTYMQKEGCVPQSPVFRRWRERQVNRCWAEFGARNAGMVHAPVMFELTEGCSVGCPFCGLNAGRLSGALRYTWESAALWREVLETFRDLVGPATASGTCYYATEPMDNPDYEQFIEDFYEEFGMVPQITTAAALRNPERTRRLLKKQEKMYRCVHRFSVLSLENLYEIFRQFTPRELLYTELLPQFSEAPSNHFSSVGRSREEGAEQGGETICCVSGLVVNMVSGTIRLVTPCGADDAHPTGELEIARKAFAGAGEFRSSVEALIREYMAAPFDYDAPLAFYPYLRFEKQEHGFQLQSESGSTVAFGGFASPQADAYTCAGELINAGNQSATEIAMLLEEERRIPPEQTFYAVTDCYQRGVLTYT